MPVIISAIVASLIQFLSRTYLNATPVEGLLLYFISFIAFMLVFILDTVKNSVK